MINVINTERAANYTSKTMTNGKHTVEVAVWNDGSVMVCHTNARRTGKHFESFAEAVNAYKSCEVKEMIQLLESEVTK